MEEFPTIEFTDEEGRTGGVVDAVSGEDVQFGPGFALKVEARQDITMAESGGLVITAGRDAEIGNGGALSLAAGHDLRVENGGSWVMVTGNNAEVTNGGAMALVAGNVASVQKGFVGVLLTRQAELSENSRVLLDTRQAVVAGAALGVVFALLSWLLRRR